MAKAKKMADVCADCGVELTEKVWASVDSNGKIQCPKCSGFGFKCPRCDTEMSLPIVPRKCPSCLVSCALEAL